MAIARTSGLVFMLTPLFFDSLTPLAQTYRHAVGNLRVPVALTRASGSRSYVLPCRTRGTS